MKKVLVTRLSALGDVCMTLPVIESVCRSYPDVEFHFLTNKLGANIANTLIKEPNLKLIPFNKNEHKGIIGLTKFYWQLRKLQFDAVADLHNVLRTQWLGFCFKLSGKRVERIEKGREEKKQLVKHIIHRQLKSGIERYHDVFSRLGFNAAVDYSGFSHGQALLCEADGKPSSTTLSQDFAIGIAPFAQHKGKIYPTDKMLTVICKLVQKFPHLQIFLFGSKEEKSILDEWKNLYPNNVFNLAGVQTIKDDLVRMAKLRLMVSMDSANMHLASLVGLRCVSIWGATHPYAGFLGFGQSENDCIQLPLDCRPCSVYGNKPCTRGDYPCLKDIDPEIIAQRIESILKDNA